jgi:hypothetical protein
MDWAAKHRMAPVTRTLLEIWQADDPALLRKLDRENRLFPLIKRLEANLDQAQDLRAEATNRALPTFEILQMAEVPLTIPRETSASQPS